MTMYEKILKGSWSPFRLIRKRTPFYLAIPLFVLCFTLYAVAFLVYLIAYLIKGEDEQPKETPQVVDNTIYYTIRKVRMSKYSLEQYVVFTRIIDNKVEDITNLMASEHDFLCKYNGRSEDLKNTIVLKDFDIVKLEQSLGDTKLVLV